MPKTDELIQRLLKTIDSEINTFNDKVPARQKELYNRVLLLLKNLEVDGGQLKNSAANWKAIDEVVKEITSLASDKSYQKDLAKFAGAFDAVGQLHTQYFSSLVGDFGSKAVLKQIQKNSVTATINSLTDAGLAVRIGEPVRKILTQNIGAGGNYSDLLSKMQGFLMNDKESDGALSSYAKQITTDALNQFSRTYSEAITQDLGLKWRTYVGSELETTRPFCHYMLKKRFFHVDEIPELLTDNIDGVKICSKDIPCGKKSGLPSGMIPGTNTANFCINCGGFGCGHQAITISDDQVPLAIREAFAAKYGKKGKKAPVEKAPSPKAPEPKAGIPVEKIFTTRDPIHAANMKNVVDQADGVSDIINENGTIVALQLDTESAGSGFREFKAAVGITAKLHPIAQNSGGHAAVDGSFMQIKIKEGQIVKFKGYDEQFKLSFDQLKEKFGDAVRVVPTRTGVLKVINSDNYTIGDLRSDGTIQYWTVSTLSNLHDKNIAPTISHESGHMLHFGKDNTMAVFTALQKKRGLSLFDAPTLYGKKDQEEFVAESLSMYIYAPEHFKARYPKAYDFFVEYLNEIGVDPATIKQPK